MDINNFDGDEAVDFTMENINKWIKRDKYDKVKIIPKFLSYFSKVKMFRKSINTWTRWMTLRRCLMD